MNQREARAGNGSPPIGSRGQALSRVAIALGAFSVLSALALGFLTYRNSIEVNEQHHRDFHLAKVQLLAAAAGVSGSISDASLLAEIESLWRASGGRPADEYICVVDANSRLILHSAHPDSVGNDVGENLIPASQVRSADRLRSLVDSQENYIGDYISSAGQEQIAAFAPIPGRGWMLGIHRSKTALMGEIYSGVRLLAVGFLVICGMLIPASLVLLDWRFRVSQQRRERADAALRESEEKYRIVTETAADAIISIDQNSRLLFVNPAVERIFGYSADELLGQPLTMLMPESVRPLHDAAIRRFLESGEDCVPREGVEATAIHKNGQEIPIEISFAAVKRKEGGYLFTSVVRNVAERKRAEAEHKELETRLCHMRRMEAIGTLAGGIAHDFNNILGPILGYSEMVMQASPEGGRIRAQMEQVLKAGKRAKDLVRQILTFSRQGESEAKAVRIDRIVTEVVELLRASLPSTIEIRKDFGAECGWVWADPIQIHQVVLNLCTNAYDAMREEGGVLEVRVAEVEVDSKCAPADPNLEPGSYATLSINDSGHGMDEKTKARIFEPFFTTKEVGQGTGLGLATVHGIVTGLGGDITVESEPQKGTTVRVFLPRTGGDAASEASGLGAAPEGNERILLVDDEVAIVRMAQELLEHLGYSVSAWTSSVGALEAFRAHPDQFDLIITDQTMPTMTGMKLAGELMHIRPGIPIILATGFSETVRPEDAFSIGIREYLMKPVSGLDLAKVIRRVLDEGDPASVGRRATGGGLSGGAYFVDG
jgi:PAS domain S-box-containing protein